MNEVALPAVRPPVNATETRLLEEALTIFAEKGYEAASVREIIEAAGVTRPVLYYYCASKEELFRRLVHWKHEASYQEFERIANAPISCEARLIAVARGSFAFCAADIRVPRIMFQTTFGPHIPGISEFLASLGAIRFGRILDIMRDGIKRRELAKNEPSSLAAMFCALMDHQLNLSSRSPHPLKELTDAAADRIVSLFFNGARKLL